LATHWQQQCKKFQRFYQLILAGNRQLNLTCITNPLEFWEKHRGDSTGIAPLLTTAANQLSSQRVIIDIGTGAGFPEFQWRSLWPT